MTATDPAPTSEEEEDPGFRYGGVESICTLEVIDYGVD